MEKPREVLETPLLHPERFARSYNPSGTVKTLTTRAVANRTNTCFIRVIGSELVQKFFSKGVCMVHGPLPHCLGQARVQHLL